MKRSSRIALIITLVAGLGLLLGYFLLQERTPEKLTQADAIVIVQDMEKSFRRKDVNGVLAYLAPQPGVRIINLSPDRMRLMLLRYFRYSNKVQGDMTNWSFGGNDQEAILQFDLKVMNNGGDNMSEDYKGHITVYFRRVDVPQLLGLIQTKEWRIVRAESTGPNLENFGD